MVVAVTVPFERETDSSNAALICPCLWGFGFSDLLPFLFTSTSWNWTIGTHSVPRRINSCGQVKGPASLTLHATSKNGVVNTAQYFQWFCNNDFCSSLLSNSDSEFRALLLTCSSLQRLTASACCFSLACNLVSNTSIQYLKSYSITLKDCSAGGNILFKDKLKEKSLAPLKIRKGVETLLE